MFAILATILSYVPSLYAGEDEILVLGTVEETISAYQQADFWGEVDRSKPLDVPRPIVVVIIQSWKEEAKQVPVDVKKELFFRALVPLILYANELTKKIEIDHQKKMNWTSRTTPTCGMSRPS